LPLTLDSSGFAAIVQRLAHSDSPAALPRGMLYTSCSQMFRWPLHREMRLGVPGIKCGPVTVPVGKENRRMKA
jgi:hypothetical protein